MRAEVTGIEEANKALTDEIKKVSKVLSERFVTKSMISISSNTLPMIPIDTSHLVNSEYRKMKSGVMGFEGELGYGADYAGYVHDAPGTLKGQPRAHFGKTKDGVSFGGGSETGNYWDPTGEPEYLKKGVEDFVQHDLDKILKSEFGA